MRGVLRRKYRPTVISVKTVTANYESSKKGPPRIAEGRLDTGLLRYLQFYQYLQYSRVYPPALLAGEMSRKGSVKWH